MMIDLILFGFASAMFAAGFWAGAQYGTYQNAWKAIKAKLLAD
jgi:hypothetical protein